MAREILFRGIAKYNGNHFFSGEMVFGSLIEKSIGIFIYVIEEDNLGNIHRECEVEVNYDSIGQFTGLIDKNGVKIFEGDIIRVCKNKNGAFVVTFKNQYVGGWVLEHSKGELSLGARKQDEIEVIGNIFCNPELVGV